jgi:hypothetical protein
MPEPIDIIRQLSDNFVEEHKKDNFAKMLIPLREKLATLDSLTNKRTFLRYIKTNVEHELELHILKVHPFGKPEQPCCTEIHDKQFIFYIDQELSIIDKFEEKEKKNFLQQFDNNTIITALISVIVPLLGLAFYLGIQQQRNAYLEKELLIFRDGTTNPKTDNETKRSSSRKNTKDSSNNFIRNKHNNK